jgi:alkylated DNA repair dioxygenase AlkB
VTFFDTPYFVGPSWVEQLEALPWEEVLSQGGILTRHSLRLAPRDCICSYAYGRTKQVYEPVNILSFLETMTRNLEQFLGLEAETLNSLNANKYSQPKHDLQWHSDNGKLFRASEFDRDTLIVSVSFGATRTFSIRKN